MDSPASGKRGHAVVVGASIGGLIIARALADSFERVTLVDRDTLPDHPETRRGVPQGRQVHGLLAGGREALEELFPGLSQELIAVGVPEGDLQSQVHWYLGGHLLKPGPSGLKGLAPSRALLEFTIRARVARLPGVRFIERHDVTGLTASPDRSRITGVRLRDRDDSAAAEAVLDADLVVDAAGRSPHSPAWLAELGYGPAPEEEAHFRLVYVSQLYRREPHHLGGRVGTAVATYPGQLRSGFVLAQEGDRFILGLSGWAGEEPPTDDEGMAEYASTLVTQDFAEVIRTAKPLSEPVVTRYSGGIRRHYEQVTDFPQDYLATADALCSFNPFYGQGMTVAALEGLILTRLLGEGREDLPRRFFEATAKLLDTPWNMALSSDMRLPDYEGPRPAALEQTGAYMQRYWAAAAEDAVLATALLRVTNMLDDPGRLTGPELQARVLRALGQPDQPAVRTGG
jgi:2-polyprenyl-6-methoxyphenol hydroxylase-like FAD-dependent oxidoreductase